MFQASEILSKEENDHFKAFAETWLKMLRLLGYGERQLQSSQSDQSLGRRDVYAGA